MEKYETGSGMNIPFLIFENLVSVCGIKTTLLYFLVPGSCQPCSRGGKKSDPGSGINIPDPQHWLYTTLS
jgi:hypothetical protein